LLTPIDDDMHKATLFAAMLLCPGVWAASQAFPSVRFQHKDWEIACDNTRTCRAVGYQSEGDGLRASILLTRPAGSGQAVQARLRLVPDEDETLPPAVTMVVNGKALGTVRMNGDTGIGELTPQQTLALLPAVLADGQIAWDAGGEAWTLSTQGAPAVLLKMDEFQGRLGTPGALVRKGDRPESSVLAALPAPVLTPAPVPVSTAESNPIPAQERPALLKELRGTIKDGDCDDFPSLQDAEDELKVYPLGRAKLLVSVTCWVAPYNRANAYWLINDGRPYSPTLVSNDANAYAGGVLSTEQKGRGIGDCRSHEARIWDGKGFVLSASFDTGMCRGFGGGAWKLPTFVSTIKKQP
jgi:hypothetical protein